MRRLRLIFIVLIVITVILAGGGVYLWRIGGETLDQLATPTATVTQSPKNETVPAFQPPFTYQLQDIPTTTSDNQAALTNYGRAVGAIMAVYNDKETENELALVNKAAEKPDPQAVAKLTVIATRHAGTAARLKALVVPPTVAQVHLNLINSLIGLAESSYLMAQIDKEPVVALQSAQIYPARLKNFFTAGNNLNFFLLASNVVLPESERSVISLGL